MMTLDLDQNVRDFSHALWMQGNENYIVYGNPLDAIPTTIHVTVAGNDIEAGTYRPVIDFVAQRIILEAYNG